MAGHVCKSGVQRIRLLRRSTHMGRDADRRLRVRWPVQAPRTEYYPQGTVLAYFEDGKRMELASWRNTIATAALDNALAIEPLHARAEIRAKVIRWRCAHVFQRDGVTFAYYERNER